MLFYVKTFESDFDCFTVKVHYKSHSEEECWNFVYLNQSSHKQTFYVVDAKGDVLPEPEGFDAKKWKVK